MRGVQDESVLIIPKKEPCKFDEFIQHSDAIAKHCLDRFVNALPEFMTELKRLAMNEFDGV